MEFVSLADRAQMPGCARACSTGPYVEGLRLDEAMHPLTLLAFGLYGEVLPNQNGAPLRLVVPWKYGFQERQVDRENPLRRARAAHRLGEGGGAGIRLLFKRESERRPSALEPGHRAPHRRGRPVPEEAADADVQRLRAQVGQLYAGMDLKKYF